MLDEENLKTTHYSNGTEIPLGTSESNTVGYRYNPNSDASNVDSYGYLYNWPAVMNGASSSNEIPSGVQGICPVGWHVPSNAELIALTDYVSTMDNFPHNSTSSYIAKVMASTTGWVTNGSSSSPYSPGNDPATNNASGFNATPEDTILLETITI